MVQDTVADALFGLTGVRVVEVDTEPDHSVTVYVQTAVVVACPDCAVPASRAKECVTGRLRDVPYGGRQIRVVWWKRRWSCRNDACPRGSFTESVTDLPSRARVTPRLRQACAQAVTNSGRTVAETADSHGVSWHTAHDAFTDAVTPITDAPPQPVTDLGIDEVRRGRPRFTTNPNDGSLQQTADRWHTGFTDLSGTQGLLGQVEGRRADDVSGWLDTQDPAWRAGIRTISIDMCAPFRGRGPHIGAPRLGLRGPVPPGSTRQHDTHHRQMAHRARQIRPPRP